MENIVIRIHEDNLSIFNEKLADLNKKFTKKLKNAIKVLMDNGNLFFKDYEGKVSPISYCKVDDGKIFFME